MPRRHSEYIFSSYRRPHYLRRFLITLLVVLVVAVTGVLALNLVLRQQVQLTRETVTVTNLPADLEQWSILVFSDLHGQQLGAHQSAIRRVVSGMNVSSIVMTGDMLGPDGDTEALLDLVALLPSDKPKLLVLGDEDPEYLDATAHGSLSAKADWAVELEAAGVTILDEPLLFTRASTHLVRAGGAVQPGSGQPRNALAGAVEHAVRPADPDRGRGGGEARGGVSALAGAAHP